MNDFELRLEGFLNGCQAICDNKIINHGIKFKSVLSIMRGRRYIRVVREYCGSESVHCFVDTTNGAILMAAGWKGPAKHDRGYIFDADYGLHCMTEYGTKYLK